MNHPLANIGQQPDITPGDSSNLEAFLGLSFDLGDGNDFVDFPSSHQQLGIISLQYGNANPGLGPPREDLYSGGFIPPSRIAAEMEEKTKESQQTPEYVLRLPLR